MINDKEYWEKRFSSKDWDKFSGGKQTEFFYKLAVENFPTWFIDDIVENGYSILDFGCAQGEGTNLLASRFISSDVIGIDIADSAIKTATQKFSQCKFRCADILKTAILSDVIFSSNTLEHFSNPLSVINSLIKSTRKYFVLEVPFKEFPLHSEHFSMFDYNSFPLYIENFSLVYYKEINCRHIGEGYWDGKQILLIYVNADYLKEKHMSLKNMHNGDFEVAEIFSDFIDGFNQLVGTEFNKTFEKYGESVNSKEILDVIDKAKKKLEVILDAEKQKEKIFADKEYALKKEIAEKNNEILTISTNKNKEISVLEQELFRVTSTRSWKFILKYYRVANGLKKLFIHNKRHSKYPIKGQVPLSTVKPVIMLTDYEYRRQDIIFLSIINYDFRYQRPQHLASRFAKSGNRVFYFNSDFKSSLNMTEIADNTMTVDFDNHYGESVYTADFSVDDYYKQQLELIVNHYNIRDCTVICEYPTWLEVANNFKEQYGFKVVFDYLDDFSGFTNTANNVLSIKAERFLKLSDLSVATSTFLFEKIHKNSLNTQIIRNGTEFEYFNKAYLPNRIKGKTIGYYGAISDWFDIDIMEYVAQSMLDTQIILIGAVSCSAIKRLENYNNVTFLGEKKYDELVNYLKDFDVCVIPFKSDIDLIKATNPVKFYEYLSAGKKIVATEIPELYEYKDRYVYLTNDKQEFVNYIRLCLGGNDILLDENQLIKCGSDNDWKIRFATYDSAIKSIYSKVSIIILTFNNLELTQKCINSIFEKSAYPNFEVIIVDNASTDDTPEYLKALQQQHDNIKLVLNEVNIGFAAGNNLGIKQADGDYIILLNNDTVVTRGWINGLIKHLDRDDNIGMICPVTNSIGNEAKINVDYISIKDLDRFAAEYTTLHFNELYTDIKVLAMFCVAFTREVLEQIGPLDENYEVGMFEDDDYSLAVQKKGFRIACAEDVFVHHFGMASFGKLENNLYDSIFNKNKAYYENKWNVKWIPHKFRDGVIT